MIFEAGNETREKIWSDFGAEQKWRAEQKESGFCSYSCFWESEKLMCEKIFSKWAKFFLFTCGILKQFFSFNLVKRFGYDFVSILGWFR